jgi:hypothetical protein
MGTIWNADVRVEDGSRMLALASPQEANRPQHHDEVRACWGTPKGPGSRTRPTRKAFMLLTLVLRSLQERQTRL